MGEWERVVGVLEPVAIGLLLIILGWAAFERGRIHHHLAPRRGDSGQHAAAHLGGRRAERLLAALFRFTHRARRIHLAVGAVAGCV